MPKERPDKIRTKPTGAVVEDVVKQSEDLMKQSQQAAEAGVRLTAELNELAHRADEALDWRKQLARHPLVPLALAAGTSLLGFAILARRR